MDKIFYYYKSNDHKCLNIFIKVELNKIELFGEKINREYFYVNIYDFFYSTLKYNVYYRNNNNAIKNNNIDIDAIFNNNNIDNNNINIFDIDIDAIFNKSNNDIIYKDKIEKWTTINSIYNDHKYNDKINKENRDYNKLYHNKYLTKIKYQDNTYLYSNMLL